IRGRAATAHPNRRTLAREAAAACAQRDVEDTRDREGGLAQRNDPAAVGAIVAMRGPRRVDRAIVQQQRSALLVLSGRKSRRSERRGNLRRAGRELVAGG